MDQLLLQNLLEEFQTRLYQVADITLRETKFSVASNKIRVALGMRRTGKSTFLYTTISVEPSGDRLEYTG